MPKCKFKVQYKKTIRWQWKSQRWKLKDQRYWNFYFTGKYFGHNYRNLQQTIKPLGSHHFDSSSSSSAFFCNFKDPSTALGSTVQWQFFHNYNSYCHPLWQRFMWTWFDMKIMKQRMRITSGWDRRQKTRGNALQAGKYPFCVIKIQKVMTKTIRNAPYNNEME